MEEQKTNLVKEENGTFFENDLHLEMDITLNREKRIDNSNDTFRLFC